MSNFHYHAALVGAAIVFSVSAQAQTPNNAEVQRLKHQIKQDEMQLRHDRAAARHAVKAAAPRRAEVLAAVNRLKVAMAAKRQQMQMVKQQLAIEKNPGRRLQLERQIGSLHRELEVMQHQSAEALLYNKMP